MAYHVYLLRCADGTFYTGIATDLARRISEHNEGAKGAAYTRGRRPVELVYAEEARNRSEAQKREYVIRILRREQKQALARQWA